MNLGNEQNAGNQSIDALQILSGRYGKWFSQHNSRKEIVKVLAVTDKGIATSGTAIRGQHIYNPHNPVTPLQDIVSLTVVGPNVYEADRFATAAFAMGKRGIYFIEQLPGFEGYMIDASARATFTSGFERYVLAA